jgi:hypothetical protein
MLNNIQLMSGYNNRQVYFNDFSNDSLYNYGYNSNLYNGYDMTENNKIINNKIINNKYDINYIKEYGDSPKPVDNDGSLSYIIPYSTTLNYQPFEQKITSPISQTLYPWEKNWMTQSPSINTFNTLNY